jgi:hypothetical protein
VANQRDYFGAGAEFRDTTEGVRITPPAVIIKTAVYPRSELGLAASPEPGSGFV